MHCNSVLDLMKSLRNTKYKLYFTKYNETFCTSSHSYDWFNSTEKVALNQLEIIDKVKCILNFFFYNLKRYINQYIGSFLLQLFN